HISVARSGWLAKYILVADGRRQIIDLLLPAELATTEQLVQAEASFSISALTDVEVCSLDRGAVAAGIQRRPDILCPLGLAVAAQAQRLRRLLATVGRQSAEARVASFIVTLSARLGHHTRLEAKMLFPLRQKDIADMLGMNQAHVGRMLRSL